MKIVHVYKSYFPNVFGGVERFIESLILSDTSKENTYVVVCIGNKNFSYTYHGIRVISFKLTVLIASTPISLSFLFRSSRILNECDLIHYHYPYPFADFTHIVNNIKTPYVITYHSDIVSQRKLRILYSPFEKIFLTNALKIFATSPNYIKSSKLLNKYQYKTQSIPIGISFPKFKKRELDFNLPKKFFCFVGVLRYYKGIEILLKASHLNRLPLVIIGDGPFKKKIISYIKRYKLYHIYYLGSLDNEKKFNVLSKSLALVFPSTHRSEAFGISLLEAFALKKPAIGFELNTGTSYVNKDGHTGIILKKISHTGLSSAMKKLWADEKYTMKLGNNAKNYYLSKFNINLFGISYRKEYQNFIIPSQKYVTVSLVLYKNTINSVLALVSNLSLIRNSLIYLIDNSPKPILGNSLLSKYPNVIYFFMNKNLGYGKGHNFPLNFIENKSKYHLIINPDICFDINVLRKLTREMDLRPSASVCMPKITYKNGRNQYLAKLLPNFFILIIRRFFRHVKINLFQTMLLNYELRKYTLNPVADVPTLSGCFLLLRTEDFVAINGFDPRFFMYMEDVDLVRRLKFNGKKETLYFSNLNISHGYAKRSYKSLKHLFFHSISAIKYFSKWGWIFDNKKNEINKNFISQLK